MTLTLDDFEPYGEPKFGDVVYHIDEPEKGCEGLVVTVGDSYFEIKWYDGQADHGWLNDDHPDILKLKDGR